MLKLNIDEKLWRPIDIQYQDGGSSLIFNELGWKPNTSLRDGIKTTYNWYISNLS